MPSDKEVAENLNQEYNQETWNLSKSLWHEIHANHFLEIDSYPASEKAFLLALQKLLVEKHILDRFEDLLRSGSISVAGGVSESTLITGNNNVLNEIKYIVESVSDAEAALQEEALEQKRLRKAIGAYVKSLKNQLKPTESEISQISPYKKLSFYEIRDHSIFFGREKVIEKLLDYINRSNLTILHAPSGAGKTSLLRAGVEPRLIKAEIIPYYIRPIDNSIPLLIKQTILPNLENSPVLAESSLQDFLRNVTRFLANHQRLVIIVDQFEEFFTMQKMEDRSAFMKELARCLSDGSLPVRWVLSLRGEWFSQLGEFEKIIPKLFKNHMLLSRLSRKEAATVIRKPAETSGVVFEDQVVDEIIERLLDNDNQNTDGIDPPQLQLVCSTLFEKRGENNTITIEQFINLGRTSGILQQHLEDELRNFKGQEYLIAKQVMVSLVSSEGTRVFRSRDQIYRELTAKGTDVASLTESLDSVLERLRARHLLRLVERSTELFDTIVYELAHEYLTDKVELDDISQNIKIAREIIEFKARHFERNRKNVLNPVELALVKKYREAETFSPREKDLIQTSERSAITRRLLEFFSYFLVFGAGFSVVVSVVVIIIQGLPQVLPEGYLALFWGGIGIFSILGSTRSWEKEIQVTFGVILALSINHTLSNYIPAVVNLGETSESLFWLRALILLALTYLGYQSVTWVQSLALRESRERLQDSLLGTFLGGINGYLLIGTLWFYLDKTGYTPFGFNPPVPGTLTGDVAIQLLKYLPPAILGGYGIYAAMVIMFIIFIVIFI